MKKWTDLASLSLLDDQEIATLPPRALDELTRTATRAQQAPRTQPSQPGSAGRPPQGRLAHEQARPTPKPSTRVFSSRPTLRQMMHDYNKRSARTAPIKCHTPNEGRDVFSFQSVDLIQIPNIPGKILRPARKSDADA